MYSIILAAGQGTRLGKPFPKCLIKIGNGTLLERHLDLLSIAGVTVYHVVIGQGGVWTPALQQNVRAIVERYGGRTTVNDLSMLTHSAASLALGICNVASDVVVLDGDVFYDKTILLRLVQQTESTIVVTKAPSGTGGSRVTFFESEEPHALYAQQITEQLDSDYVYVGMMKICRPDLELFKQKLSSGMFDSQLLSVLLNTICQNRRIFCLIAGDDLDDEDQLHSKYPHHFAPGNVINLNTEQDLLRLNEASLP